jgi:hypothetical protein
MRPEKASSAVNNGAALGQSAEKIHHFEHQLPQKHLQCGRASFVRTGTIGFYRRSRLRERSGRVKLIVQLPQKHKGKNLEGLTP